MSYLHAKVFSTSELRFENLPVPLRERTPRSPHVICRSQSEAQNTEQMRGLLP